MRPILLPLLLLLAAGCHRTEATPAPVGHSGRPWPVGAWNMPGWVEVTLIPTEDGQFHLEVEVGTERLTMLLDTGAAVVVLDRYAVAERLKLPMKNVRTRGMGVGGTVTLHSTSLPPLKIGSFESSPGDVSVADLSYINEYKFYNGEPPIDGILGASFLHAHKAVIDYPQKKILLYDLANGPARASGEGTAGHR